MPRHLLGDALRVRQVVRQLYDNAVKFTEHGKIVVGVRCLERSAEYALLEVSVRDTGIGLDDEQKARISIASNSRTTRSPAATPAPASAWRWPPSWSSSWAAK